MTESYEREAWFYEEKDLLGNWCPAVIYGRKPPLKSPDGARHKIRSVTRLNGIGRKLDLNELQRRFSVKPPAANAAPEALGAD